MQEEKNPLTIIIETATKTIVKELYSDIKKWAVSSIGPFHKIVKNIKKKKYSSIHDLLSDLSKGKIRNGDLVEIECKLSSFGPFIKPIYISPLVGMNTQNRLGPPLQHPNPHMGLVAQAISNLTPVGLYPPISDKVTQVRLYPSNAEALGFFSLFPGVNDLVPSINALIKPEFLSNAHKSCKLTGNIKCIMQQDFVNAGYKLEDFEVVRSIENIWFFDATGEDSACKIIENEIPQLWGALYSAGQLEIDRNIHIKPHKKYILCKS